MLPIDPIGNDSSNEEKSRQDKALEDRSLLDSSEEESQEVAATDENLSMTQLIDDPTTTSTSSDIDSTTSPEPLEVVASSTQDHQNA